MAGLEGYNEHFNAEVRLIILKALADQPDGRLNSSMLVAILESYAVNRTRQFVHTQLRWMETEAQAVILTDMKTVLIAELTEQGEGHLQRKCVIEGIKPPSRPKG